MSIHRIKGDDGVIIDSQTFLELPKAPNATSTGITREGMLRYNMELGAFEGVMGFSDGNVGYRRFPQLDANGRLLTSQLPDSITSGLIYAGTYNPVLDDIDPPRTAGVYTALPLATQATSGQYYIVRGIHDLAAAHFLANSPSTSPVTFTPDNPNGTVDWMSIKYYFNSTGITSAFGAIIPAVLTNAKNPGLIILATDATLTQYSTNASTETALQDGDWVINSDSTWQRLRQNRVSILAGAVRMDNSLVLKANRPIPGSDSSTVQAYIDSLSILGVRRSGDSMIADGSSANGRLAFTYGTATAPAITFNNTVFNPDTTSGLDATLWSDANTGLFHPGTGIVSISSAGTERFRVAGTGATIYQSTGLNTSTAASLVLQHSTNTSVAGISAYSNKLYITVGGVAQGTFDANGLTLIGALNTSTANFTGNVSFGTDSTNTMTVNSTGSFLAPVTFASTLTANGNVVIGDAAADTLTVTSTSTFSSLVNFGANIVVTGSATLNGNVSIGDAAADVILIRGISTFSANSTFTANLTANGNVTLGDAAADVITVNGTSTFAATAPVTVNGNLTVKGNTAIGDANADTLTVLAVTSFGAGANVTIAGTLTANGNVAIGDAAADTLTVLSTSTFSSPVTFNGNVTIGDAATDTLTVTSTSTFSSPVTFTGNVNIGDAAADVITIAGSSTFSAPVTVSSTLAISGATKATMAKIATGMTLTLGADTEEFSLLGSTATLMKVGNYGVQLPVINTSTAAVKVGAVAYDSTAGGVYAGIGTAWVPLNNSSTSTAFTATWVTDTPNSEIYVEIPVTAKDAVVYETKSGYNEKRTDVKIRVYPTAIRVVLPSTGTAFAGTLVSYK